MIDEYQQIAWLHQFELLFGPITLPLTADEKQVLKSAEKVFEKVMHTIELEIEKLDALPLWVRGAFARAAMHEMYRATFLRTGLPVDHRPGRESVRALVGRLCYR